MRIIVTGSLAYDYIMNVPGKFADHILPDKVHMLTVSFLVDSMKKMRGGVAGNVAYTLSLLGEKPLVVSAAGQDFADYRKFMESKKEMCSSSAGAALMARSAKALTALAAKVTRLAPCTCGTFIPWPTEWKLSSRSSSTSSLWK